MWGSWGRGCIGVGGIFSVLGGREPFSGGGRAWDGGDVAIPPRRGRGSRKRPLGAPVRIEPQAPEGPDGRPTDRLGLIDVFTSTNVIPARGTARRPDSPRRVSRTPGSLLGSSVARDGSFNRGTRRRGVRARWIAGSRGRICPSPQRREIFPGHASGPRPGFRGQGDFVREKGESEDRDCRRGNPDEETTRDQPTPLAWSRCPHEKAEFG